MSETSKITHDHLRRCAYIYVRQSSPGQVEHHRESTEIQYGLVNRAIELGWNREQVNVIDKDLGVSATGLAERAGFEHMTAQVALGCVGIVFGTEVSRVARNNAEWYRLLDLCGVTNTLIADGDGVYHPGLFNDRLVLGLKGAMSEAELHVMRARLQGGSRNKAARGELRSNLPIGFVWGEEEGEMRLHPDEAIIGAIRTVFQRFAETGSIRQAWLWMRAQELELPRYFHSTKEIRWVAPTYLAMREILISPVYAGAYAYGKTRVERFVDERGQIRKRRRKLPRSEWAVLIPDHHEGYIDWQTYEANQARIASNVRPGRGETGGAVREGAALLQGIGTCGHCGRGLRVVYSGRKHTPHYFCASDQVIEGRGERHLWVSGHQLHEPVVSAFLEALKPAGMKASVRAAERLETNHDAALAQWERQAERARYEAQLAERRYRAVDPDNRLVARGLEGQWEKRLQELQQAEAELARRAALRPRILSAQERASIMSLGTDLQRVWRASTMTDRDRKELLRTLLEEVIVAIDKPGATARLNLRWRGGLITDLDVALSRRRAHNRTDEETVDLVRRLAEHYPDAMTAGILNRQGRKTSTGLCFTADRLRALRNYWRIPCFQPPAEEPEGEVVSLNAAARILGVNASTVHRWLHAGIIPGEQLTPGAPWRIRMTEQLRTRFVEEAPEGYVRMQEAIKLLGVSRQTVLHRVKRGELKSLHVRRGRIKGLLIKVPDRIPELFDRQPTARE